MNKSHRQTESRRKIIIKNKINHNWSTTLDRPVINWSLFTCHRHVVICDCGPSWIFSLILFEHKLLKDLRIRAIYLANCHIIADSYFFDRGTNAKHVPFRCQTLSFQCIVFSLTFLEMKTNSETSLQWWKQICFQSSEYAYADPSVGGGYWVSRLNFCFQEYRS